MQELSDCAVFVFFVRFSVLTASPYQRQCNSISGNDWYSSLIVHKIRKNRRRFKIFEGHVGDRLTDICVKD